MNRQIRIVCRFLILRHLPAHECGAQARPAGLARSDRCAHPAGFAGIDLVIVFVVLESLMLHYRRAAFAELRRNSRDSWTFLGSVIGGRVPPCGSVLLSVSV